MVGEESFGEVKLKGMLYGDDNYATVVDEAPPYQNDKGIKMKRYLVVPHPHLIKQYPFLQKPGVINVRTHKGMAIWVDYPEYWVDDRNPSRTHAIVRVKCGFDGRKTLQTEESKHLTEEIKLLQEQLENAQISIIHLQEENKLLMDEMKAKMKDIYELQRMQPHMQGEYGGDEGGEDGRPR